MPVTLSFSTETPAFKDDFFREVSRVLARAAVKSLEGITKQSIRDNQGNLIGRVDITRNVPESQSSDMGELAEESMNSLCGFRR
jgi:hypothetical protein